MRTRLYLSSLAVCVMAVGLGGCGEATGPAAPTADVDPIQQETVKKLEGKAPVELPPGAMMNSGGEIILPESGDTNQ